MLSVAQCGRFQTGLLVAALLSVMLGGPRSKVLSVGALLSMGALLLVVLLSLLLSLSLTARRLSLRFPAESTKSNIP